MDKSLRSAKFCVALLVVPVLDSFWAGPTYLAVSLAFISSRGKCDGGSIARDQDGKETKQVQRQIDVRFRQPKSIWAGLYGIIGAGLIGIVGLIYVAMMFISAAIFAGILAIIAGYKATLLIGSILSILSLRMKRLWRSPFWIIIGMISGSLFRLSGWAWAQNCPYDQRVEFVAFVISGAVVALAYNIMMRAVVGTLFEDRHGRFTPPTSPSSNS